MDAIIHIGTAKTGSTSIQEFLFSNKLSLLNKKIAYVHTPGQKYHRALVMACMNLGSKDYFIKNTGLITVEAHKSFRAKSFKRLHKELRTLKRKVSTVIISCEGLYGRLNDEQQIRLLRDTLSPHFRKMRVIIYLRRQDQMAVSRYTSACRLGNVPKKILTHNIGYDYYKQMKIWANVFGKDQITVRIFDPTAFLGGDLIQDFVETSGLPEILNFPRPDRLNETLPAPVVNALLFLNSEFPTFVQQKPVRIHQYLKEFVIAELAAKYPGSGHMPSRTQAYEFMQAYTNSNQRLGEVFLNGNAPFSDDFSKYPEQASSMEIDYQLLSDLFMATAKFYREESMRLGFAKTEPQNALSVLKTARRMRYSHLVDAIHW